ncbi:MAG: T9SS type A sorting domain-containing protein [Candidatus Krumholzibacteria bacterium]|nr:T9SS type A sorting domain-containing protein [Candidatus Krumholzibacteria bacterium]
MEGGPGLVIECTNIWDPVEDAWAGPIGSQLGQNGNVAVDPLFCDPQGSNFTLSSISPCLNAPCGTMGAFGIGCYANSPRIISVNDVGNDQGRQVRLTWYRSNEDSIGGAVNGYAIYRRQDAYAASPAAIPSSGRELAALPGWDYVTTIPNRWDNVYQAVVPTLCDSTITAGECWSAFFVSALTPTGYYDSPVDSGYSKDNLAPPTPTSFAVSYNTGSGNRLVWDAVAANDWAGFRVYRGSTPGFTPSPVTLVQTTTQTTWDDPSYDGGDVQYRVTSFDIAGNESEPTSSTTVTVVGNTPQPLKLELGPNVPNPFNPSTTIPFTIPSAGRVTITIYNVSGARVRTLVNAEYQPGTHSAVWDGRNDAGATVGSGVYLARLAHAGAVQSRKMVVTK